MVDRTRKFVPGSYDFPRDDYFIFDPGVPEITGVRAGLEQALLATGREEMDTHDALLAGIYWLDAMKKVMDREIAWLVEQALRLGWSWQAIGRELGMSRQAAHKRFASLVAGIDDGQA